MRSRLLSLPVLCVFAALSSLGGLARAGDLAKLDLTGEWYVLVHYKNAKSEDKSITDWKDLGWSMVQTGDSLTVQEFPYVMFDEGTEEVRRAAMRGHTPW